MIEVSTSFEDHVPQKHVQRKCYRCIAQGVGEASRQSLSNFFHLLFVGQFSSHIILWYREKIDCYFLQLIEYIYIYIHIIVLTMFMVILAVIEDQKCPEHSICVRYYVAVVALLKIKEQYVSDRNISQ